MYSFFDFAKACHNNVMGIFDGIALGVLQGVTEFIPVSSSGHLVIAEHFLGLQSSPVFDSLINFGTFMALLIYFRQRLWGIAKRVFVDRDVRLVRNITISAVPVGLAGFFLKHFFESAAIQNAWVVVGALFLAGIVMVVLERLPRATALKSSDALSPKRAGFIGLMQMAALVPGVSRSGSTIVAGRLTGLSYAQAAEYSFLLSIPVMFAVVVLGFVGHDGRDFIQANFAVWALSNTAAFVCGLLAVGFMLKFLAKGNLKAFGVYRIALAVVVATTLIFIG
jgi:undecaprenyl-diphosphatase